MVHTVAPGSHLQLIEDGCFPSVVQTHNDDFVLCGKKLQKGSEVLSWGAAGVVTQTGVAQFLSMHGEWNVHSDKIKTSTGL